MTDFEGRSLGFTRDLISNTFVIRRTDPMLDHSKTRRIGIARVSEND